MYSLPHPSNPRRHSTSSGTRSNQPFSSTLIDPSQNHQNQHNIIIANARRLHLKATLKRAGNNNAAIIDATTEYLPHLYAIIISLNDDSLLLSTNPSSSNQPTFTWRSTLTSSLLASAHPRFTLPSYHYELIYVLFLHALALSNSCTALVASLGAYELSRALSSTEQLAYDEALSRAAESACRASGAFDFIANVALVEWEKDIGREEMRGRPVELSRDVLLALAKLSLAQANTLAIRRLLSRFTTLAQSNTAPGPPLSPTHPSPSLIAKLYRGVYDLYDSAHSLLLSSNSISSSATTLNPTEKGQDTIGTLSSALVRSTQRHAVLSRCMSYKWLGIDAGEKGGREKIGEAICWLGMAKDGLKEMRGEKEDKGQEEERECERKGVKIFWKAYSKVNDSVYFQLIPSSSTLHALIPSGRLALSSKPYQRPGPAFASTHSTSKLNRVVGESINSGREELRMAKATAGMTLNAGAEELDEGDESSSDEEGNGHGVAKSAEYFNKGSYF